MSLRTLIILPATSVLAMASTAAAETIFDKHGAVLSALGIGAIAALIASHCAEYDAQRSRRKS